VFYLRRKIKIYIFFENLATFSDISRDHSARDCYYDPAILRDAYESFNNTGDTGTQVLTFSTMYTYKLYYSKLPPMKCGTSIVFFPPEIKEKTHAPLY
jgi:hypothetical protein